MSHLVTSGSRQDPNAVLGRLSVRCKEFIYNMESYKTHWVAREEETQNRGHGSKEQNFKHEDQGGASKKKGGTQQYIYPGHQVALVRLTTETQVSVVSSTQYL